MKNDSEMHRMNLSKEEERSEAERAFELEPLEGLEYQGARRQVKKSIEVIHSEVVNFNSQFKRPIYEC